MSVNVSARQLRREDFAKTVRRIIEQSGLSPSMVELELTESALMENEDLAESILVDLSNLGVRLALDDFGTGYSSLEYLRRFPFNTLKIGQSFVAGIPQDHKSAALLEGRCRHGPQAESESDCRRCRNGGATFIPAFSRLRLDAGLSCE